MTRSLIVVDDFLDDPLAEREHALALPFDVTGNYPGARTREHRTDGVAQGIAPLEIIFSNLICAEDDGYVTKWETQYNGAYQITTSRDRSWIHADQHNGWAGVLYLTPGAPPSSGTGFYRHASGLERWPDIEAERALVGRDSQDMTRWKLVDQVGNRFNRLVLFDAKRFHSSLDYFGHDLRSGRLTQVFFFDVEG